MKFLYLLAAAVVTISPSVLAVCNEDEHHPENGGYFVEGIAGISTEIDPMSPNNRRFDNATWSTGIDYPDGSVVLCTGQFCSEQCRTQGCPDLIFSHTCSMIRFCYAADSGSDVWRLPGEQELANCDFTNAELVCNATQGSDDDCCNFFVEEDASLETYFFASMNGCEQGQKAAVEVSDFDEVGDACFNSGTTTSRIKNCDCLFETRPSTLSEPCHSKFSQGCVAASPADTACCASGDCCSIFKDINMDEGKAQEATRKSLCNDAIPGKCDDGSGTIDCCTKTCSTCGAELGCDADWSNCALTDDAAAFQNASCGFTPSFTAFECDFSACQPGDLWHPESDAFKLWAGIATPSDAPATAPVDPTVSPNVDPPVNPPVTPPVTPPVAVPTSDSDCLLPRVAIVLLSAAAILWF